jgi:hypothetical protein
MSRTITEQKYGINPIMRGMAKVRVARKDHGCAGGHNGLTRTTCADPIKAGDEYVNYWGESPAYQSGKHYHVHCALEQGILIKIEG